MDDKKIAETDYISQIQNLSRRLAALESERDVVATLNRYGHAIDYGDETGWLDCFTNDAAFDLRFQVGDSATHLTRLAMGKPTANGVRIEGWNNLAKFIAQHSRAPEAYHKHYLMEPIVTPDVSAGTATARSYFMRVDLIEGVSQIYAFGRYLDKLIRQDDGLWRFKERIAEIESS